MACKARSVPLDEDTMWSLPAMVSRGSERIIGAALTVLDGDGAIEIGEKDQLGRGLHVRERDRPHRGGIWRKARVSNKEGSSRRVRKELTRH